MALLLLKQNHLYAWKYIPFFFDFYSLSTLHICLYFNVLDRIIKYFPNIISLKKATKPLLGQKHFCLWLKGKQIHWMAFYFCAHIHYPVCSPPRVLPGWEWKLLSISGGKWPGDSCTNAVEPLCCFKIPHWKSRIVSHLPRNAFYFSIV